MKWIFYPVLLFAVAGCTLHGQEVRTAAAVTYSPKAEATSKKLDPAMARQMFDFYKDRKVKKDASFFVEFDREELIALLEESDQPTVKLLVGAYSDGEENGKSLRPTILLQTAHSAASGMLAAPFVDFRYHEATRLCPPPSPCRLEN